MAEDSRTITVSVGPASGDFVGTDDRTIQAAIETVAALGGGTVRVLPGVYRLHNSVRLRSGVALVGSGDDTVLRKEPSAEVPLIEDTDWYECRVTVADSSPFRVGGGVVLQARCPHGGLDQVSIHTILAIEGNTLWLDAMARGVEGRAHLGNFWVGYDARASTSFSPVVGYRVHDIALADLRIDGNRPQSECLNGNYAAAIFLQDCERVTVRNVRAGNTRSDGLSFQVVHDLTVEGCTFEDCAQGIHPGSGAQRPVIRGNRVRRCETGLFWCWGVRHGLAEGNTIEDCNVGISIGHRDTDNVMRGNTVRHCASAGLLFRDDPERQAAHRNVVDENLFEDIGAPDAPGCGIDIAGPVQGAVLRGNRIVSTRPAGMAAGIRIGAQAGDTTLERNEVIGIDPAIDDRRVVRPG